MCHNIQAMQSTDLNRFEPTVRAGPRVLLLTVGTSPFYFVKTILQRMGSKLIGVATKLLPKIFISNYFLKVTDPNHVQLAFVLFVVLHMQEIRFLL
jgi:hypothetical protein